MSQTRVTTASSPGFGSGAEFGRGPLTDALLSGGDPTTGIVSVRADYSGNVTRWRRLDGEVIAERGHFDNWFLTRDRSLLENTPPYQLTQLDGDFPLRLMVSTGQCRRMERAVVGNYNRKYHDNKDSFFGLGREQVFCYASPVEQYLVKSGVTYFKGLGWEDLHRLQFDLETTAQTKEALVNQMAAALERIPGVAASFSQPIKFRMMELIEGTGARSDVVIKIFGDDMEVLREKANEIARVISSVRGATDVNVQQVTGLPVLQIKIKRDAIARYGVNVADVGELIQTAIAGTEATEVLEGFMRFDLVVRLAPWARKDIEAISNLLVSAPDGQHIPLSHLADIVSEEGPAEISRENGQRRISVEVNVRGRDIGSFVAEAQEEVDRQVKLPVGYTMDWGGMFEHLESGRNRLMVVTPVTFLLIFLLLFTTFNSLKQAMLVFTGIPFAITGGILSLLFRGMHMSMSAGIGFIAVSGVAVLNGVVLVTFINQLRERGLSMEDAVVNGALTRLRPVLMTALVARVVLYT